MRLYIAGPMTGLTDHNYPAFFEAEKRLISMDYLPINPAWIHGDTLEEALANSEQDPKSWEYYMRHGLMALVQADGLCLLDGWQASRGARAEVAVALTLNMPIMHYSDL